MVWRWGLAGVAAAAAVVLAVVMVGNRPAAKPAAPEAPALVSREDATAGLMAEYEAYVRGIDEAIEECEAALAENPQNPQVRMAYLAASSSRAGAMDLFVAGGE